MAKLKAWRDERRTGLRLAQLWVGAFSDATAASASIGMTAGYLRAWLTEPQRTFSAEVGRQVSDAMSIPFDAVMQKHERICDLVRVSEKALRRRNAA